MKSKIGVVTLLAVSLIAFAIASPAHSADWQTSVNGYPIQCEVTRLRTHLDGNWLNFYLRYTFCSGNYWELDCTRRSGDGNVSCVELKGPSTQACNGATYYWTDFREILFLLKTRTANAQNYVCDEAFKRMNVTVTPLK